MNIEAIIQEAITRAEFQRELHRLMVQCIRTGMELAEHIDADMHAPVAEDFADKVIDRYMERMTDG